MMSTESREPTEPDGDLSQATRLADFESSIDELESIVESLETGDVSLEDALTRFERGIALARNCQSLLKNAELRVDQLLADSDETDAGDRIADFDLPDNTDTTTDA